jgi:hypothetical protein
MKLQKFLTESKQSIINLGFPEVIASLLYEKFGNKAFLIAKWYKEYKAIGKIAEDKNWWRSAHQSFFSRNIELSNLVDLFNAAKVSEEEYNKVRNKYRLGDAEDYDRQETLSFLKDEIKEKFFDGGFFTYNNFVQSIINGQTTDLNPYKDLSFDEASEKFETKKVFQDTEPLKVYSDGWKWINAGKKCDFIGTRMRNCGSTGVMSTDPDRTMLTLFDGSNNPHVVATYSPNENRISGVEGGASTQIKSEYIPYVLDLVKQMGIRLDTQYEKSKELKIKYILGDNIKNLQLIYQDTFNEIYKLTTNDKKIFFTDSYMVIPTDELKKIDFASHEKRVKTVADKVRAAFGLQRNREINVNIFPIENFQENLSESAIKSLIKNIILETLLGNKK